MNRLLNRIDRALSFKGLLSLLMALLMLLSLIPLKTQVHAVGPKKPEDVDYEKPVIVSMGDSFSSGEGIEKFYCQEKSNKEKVKEEDWLAHRSQKSWPGQLYFPGLDKQTKEYKDKNWFFVASSGATTEHLEKAQPKPYQIGPVGQYSDPDATVTKQLAIFDKLDDKSVDYVTLTLGGNDADFTGVVTEAVMGSTYLNTSKLSDMLAGIWDQYYAAGGIRDDLYDSYKKIEKAAGAQAQIIVAGYPKLLEQSGKGALFSQQEAKEINRAVSNFNIEIERIVEHCADEDMKICFVSVEKEFDGREAYSRYPYINEVYLLQSKPEELQNFVKASAYSMHPNEDGAKAYAKCVNEKIKKLAEDEEKRLEEEALNPSEKDREIVLVLDQSGSMSGTPMQETLEAAHKFVGTVFATEANVGVVAYHNFATVFSALTDSQEYLDKRINEIYASGGTNIEDGLKMADGMLSKSRAAKKIIVLMSDGEPNDGKVGTELIDYADTLKAKGYDIYTLGFFSAIGNKEAAQSLMEKIASTGCHYEVDGAEKLQFFFGDIADQISGTDYIYVRIACPVDVTVKYNGEEMTSKGNYSSLRTSFGTMTFEEGVEIPVEETESSDTYGSDTEEVYSGIAGIGGAEENEEIEETGEPDVYDNRVKILRLKEGVDYDILIEGNGKGVMNYSIGFMNEKGEYKDVRTFPNVEIAPATKIDTVATRSEETYMYVDEDGDGKYDVTYMAREGSEAEIVEDEPTKKKDLTWIYVSLGAILLVAIAAIVFVMKRREEIKKYLPA